MTEGDKLTTLPDSLLLEGLGRGDAASFETLFYRHYERVYGLLFRLVGNRAEAEDLTQEVFLRLYRRPPAGRQEHNLAAWLYQVATRLGYNALRGRRRLWQRNVYLLPDPADSPDTVLSVEERETRQRVRAALARLPQRQAQLLLLRQMGLSYEELAAVCQVAPGSVGALLARAAQAFRRVYGDE